MKIGLWSPQAAKTDPLLPYNVLTYYPAACHCQQWCSGHSKDGNDIGWIVVPVGDFHT